MYWTVYLGWLMILGGTAAVFFPFEKDGGLDYTDYENPTLATNLGGDGKTFAIKIIGGLCIFLGVSLLA